MGWLSLLLLLITIGGIVVWVRIKKKKTSLAPLLESIPKKASFEFTAAWERRQKRLISLSLPVKKIILVHGSFVGDDPFHILELLQNLFPQLSGPLVETIKAKTKLTQNIFAKDLGNFTDEHISYLKELLGEYIDIENVTWSSANNHFARVKGAFKLLNVLASIEGKDRVLLIGHSHAGQVFSLVSQFVSSKKRLRKVLSSVGNVCNIKEVHKNASKVGKLKLDFVTLGSPARYEWDLGRKMRLLHFINHRGTTTLGGDFFGVLTTKDGDYIQQWGVAGSDLPSPIDLENKINQKLDRIFGAGSDFEHLKSVVSLKRRLHQCGHHLLTDYGDNGRAPNFLLTIFGHGVYTKLKYMPFLFEQIKKYFY